MMDLGARVGVFCVAILLVAAFASATEDRYSDYVQLRTPESSGDLNVVPNLQFDAADRHQGETAARAACAEATAKAVRLALDESTRRHQHAVEEQAETIEFWKRWCIVLGAVLAINYSVKLYMHAQQRLSGSPHRKDKKIA